MTAAATVDRAELVSALRCRVQPRSSRGLPTKSLATLRTVDAAMRKSPHLGREAAVNGVLVRALERLATGAGPIEGLGSADRRSVALAATALFGLDGRKGQTSGSRHVAAADCLFVSERQVRRLVPPILEAVADELLDLEVNTPPTLVERQRPAWWVEPHELPPAPALLVGREKELKAFSYLIEGGAPTLDGRARTVVVHGPPGVGKTTLLCRVAHELASAHPDGCAWLSLDVVGGRVDEEAIVRRLLRSVGAGEKYGPGEAAAALRSAFAGRRLLIVLDGVWDEDQVEAATPPSGASLVLVAARAPLGALDGSRHLSIDPLPTDQGVLLLREVIGIRGRDDGPLSAIANSCSGLPLALRVAAARIVGDGLTPNDLAARLAKPGGAAAELRYRTKDLRAVVEEALTDLSESAIEALYAASACGGWMDGEAVTNEVIRSGLVQKVADRHRLLGVFGRMLPEAAGRRRSSRHTSAGELRSPGPEPVGDERLGARAAGGIIGSMAGNPEA